MQFKVKKGIQRELRVYGMFLPYFYLFFGISFLLLMINLFLLLLASRGEISYIAFIGSLVLSVLVFFVMKILFPKLSSDKTRVDKGGVSSVCNSINLRR